MFPHRRPIFAATLLGDRAHLGFSTTSLRAQAAKTPASPEAAALHSIYTEALEHGEAFENLRALVTTRRAASPARFLHPRGRVGEKTLGGASNRSCL